MRLNVYHRVRPFTAGSSSIMACLFIGPVITNALVVNLAMCGGKAVVNHLTTSLVRFNTLATSLTWALPWSKVIIGYVLGRLRVYPVIVLAIIVPSSTYNVFHGWVAGMEGDGCGLGANSDANHARNYPHLIIIVYSWALVLLYVDESTPIES